MQALRQHGKIDSIRHLARDFFLKIHALISRVIWHVCTCRMLSIYFNLLFKYRDRAPFGAQTYAWQPICNRVQCITKWKSSSTYCNTGPGCNSGSIRGGRPHRTPSPWNRAWGRVEWNPYKMMWRHMWMCKSSMHLYMAIYIFSNRGYA